MSVVVLRHFHVVLDVDVLDLNLSIRTGIKERNIRARNITI